MTKRIAVVGAGALGLYYGAQLQRAGRDVRFLLRRDYDAIREKGLHVTSPAGDFHLDKVKGFRSPDEIGEVDLVLVGLKTFANDRMVSLVRPLMGKETVVLTLQNGLGNEEILAAAFGSGRVMGGIAFLCSNRGEPGTVHHLGEGAIRLGEFTGGISSRALDVAALFQSAGIPCDAVDDLVRARWEKLVWNIPFNGLSALTGDDVTDLLNHPPTRRLAGAIMAEVVAAANAQGLTEPIDNASFIARMFELTDGMDHYRPSMLIDRQEGSPLELETIYAIPLQRAAARGTPMIRTEMLHTLLALGER